MFICCNSDSNVNKTFYIVDENICVLVADSLFLYSMHPHFNTLATLFVCVCGHARAFDPPAKMSSIQSIRRKKKHAATIAAPPAALLLYNQRICVCLYFVLLQTIYVFHIVYKLLSFKTNKVQHAVTFVRLNPITTIFRTNPLLKRTTVKKLSSNTKETTFH